MDLLGQALSVKRKVTATDEWCAEAYMETDYNRVLTREAFEREVKKYLLFELINEAEENAMIAMTDDGEQDEEDVA